MSDLVELSPEPVDTGIDETVLDTSTEHEDPEDAGLSDFQKWKKNEDRKQAASKKQDSESKPEAKPDAKPKDTKAVKEEKPASEPKVEGSTIKVGDKEYSSADVESLLKNTEALTQRGEEFNSKFSTFIDRLQKNPGEILEKVGVDREALEKFYFEKYLEEDTLTAEQKLEKYKARDAERLKAEDDARAQAQAEAEEAEAARKTSESRNMWQKRIQEAVTEAGLPDTDLTINLTASYIKDALVEGNQSVTAKDVMPKVQEYFTNSFKQYLDKLEPAELKTVLGDKLLGKLREYEADQLKNDKFRNDRPGQGRTKAVAGKKEGKKSYSNVYQMLDDL